MRIVLSIFLLAMVSTLNNDGVVDATITSPSSTSVKLPSTLTKSAFVTKRRHPCVDVNIDVKDDDDTFNENEEITSLISKTPRGGSTVAQSSSVMDDILQRLKIGGYFGLWYALNVMYNIVNKKVLNELPSPFIIGSMQFGVGALYAGILWATKLRKTPTLTKSGREGVATIGVMHLAGQLLTMVSLGAGPVSFTHIVKALEPFFSALVSALFFKKWMKPQVYATLIPVVGGVGYACLKERSFSWLSFYAAMGSNLAFALRAVLSKAAMVNPMGENITSTNLFGLVTWVAFILSIPVAVIMEGGIGPESAFNGLWTKALDASKTIGEDGVAIASSGIDSLELVKRIVVSGLFHYLNNEVMYLALSNVHPVTLAVGNTMKRVFIMVASILVFQNPISVQAGIGSGIGIAGVLFYSLVKQYYEKLEASGGNKK